MNNQQIIPFGKYKGQPIEVLQADKGYCEWLMAQDWFRERYPQMITVIVNNFGKPEDTPEHNALQTKFLNLDYANKLLYLFINGTNTEYKKDFTCKNVEFEVCGWDVCIDFAYQEKRKFMAFGEVLREYWEEETNCLLIEIKPDLGDDYPSVLRQMKANNKNNSSRCILVYNNFTASGATEDQVKHIFKNSNFKTYSFDEIERCELK